MLQDGYQNADQPPISAEISQSGDVPSYARSLMFESDTLDSYGTDKLAVSLNGTVVPMQLYSVDGTVNSSWGPVETYIGDISALAGQQNVELRFEKLVQDPNHWGNHGAVDLDGIQFSSVIVPEPAALLLLLVAALFASARTFPRRRCRAR